MNMLCEKPLVSLMQIVEQPSDTQQDQKKH